MGVSHRERVTVDLRGLGTQLHALASARHISAASLMRQALLATLINAPDESVPAAIRWDADRRYIKLTLRLPASHANVLSIRARAADVSLGIYVAGLLDGAPPVPLPVDHSEAVQRLCDSTDQLAVFNADLITYMRCLDRGLVFEADSDAPHHRTDLAQLIAAVRHHLEESAAVVAALKPVRLKQRPERR